MTAREQLLAIPHGVVVPDSQHLTMGWNRYDTDDEHVLHLWDGHGVSYDIRSPKQ